MWIARSLLFIALLHFAAPCENASRMFLGLFQENQDAGYISARSILEGPIYQLGKYEECVNVEQEQYCLAKLLIHSDNSSSPFWLQIQKRSSMLHFRRDVVYLGLCVPESCNPSDTEMIAVDTLEPAAKTLGVHADIILDQNTCQTKQHHNSFTTGDYIFGALVLFILAAVCIGTVYDARYFPKKDEAGERTTVENFLLCFSLISNWRKLYPANKSEAARDLQPIEGIRVILTYFVIMVHRLYFAAIAAFINPEWFEQAGQNPVKAFFIHSHPNIASFFCISGFLLGYSVFRKLENQAFTANLYWKAIINRYIRLTPAYAFLIVFSVTWMKYLGSGPLWPLIMKTEVENCNNFWWTNLLYINNYVHPERLCHLHTWYLSADFQNYATALLVLWLVNKYKHRMKIIFGAAISLAMILPLIHTYMEELNASLLLYPEITRKLLDDKTFQKSYITFHCNAAPYLLGVMFGTLFYKAKQNKLHIPQRVKYLALVYEIVVPAYILYLGFRFYQSDYVYDLTTASVFAGFYKGAYAAAIGIGLLKFCTTNKGMVNSFLCWKLFRVLSPFTYCIYLVHFAIQRIDTANMKDEPIISDFYLIRKGTVDVLISVGMAVILCFCVEMPSLALYKLYSSSGKQDKPKKE